MTQALVPVYLIVQCSDCTRLSGGDEQICPFPIFRLSGNEWSCPVVDLHSYHVGGIVLPLCPFFFGMKKQARMHFDESFRVLNEEFCRFYALKSVYCS